MIKQRSVRIVSSSSDRLDKAASLGGVRRSIFSRPDTEIHLNGKKARKSTIVKEGDEIEIKYSEDVFEGLSEEDIPLDVLYEDDDILIIDKAPGMTVHPGAGVMSGTLANALLFRYGKDFLTDMDDLRPGIVHRLDKDTSGVMVIAKNDNSLSVLSDEFKEHKTEKYYAAIARGVFKDEHGIIDKNITRQQRDRKKFTVSESRGKNARSEYFVIRQFKSFALVKIRIYTGRTHQIRVHLKSIGHEVVGDGIYSSDRTNPLMLHSYSLSLYHPRTGEKMTFTSSLPERFKAFLAENADACIEDILIK